MALGEKWRYILPSRSLRTFQDVRTIDCDKYHAVPIVRPFLDLHGWAEAFRNKIFVERHEEWLFVAWTFGYADIFGALTHRLVMRTIPDENGGCCLEERSLTDMAVPLGILESIVDLRNSTIDKLITHCHTVFEKLQAENTCQESGKSAREKCHSMTLGSLFNALQRCNIFPLRSDPPKLRIPLDLFATAIKNLIVYTYEELDCDAFSDALSVRDTKKSLRMQARKAYAVHTISHTDCAKWIDLRKTATDIISQMGSAVLDSHRLHMEEQAKL